MFSDLAGDDREQMRAEIETSERRIPEIETELKALRERCTSQGAVLIDGSEFTGKAEMEEVYGAVFLMLDDTRSYKNWDNMARLSKDPAYRLVKKSRWTRNGWAIFERKR